ncbi:hypothetical protein [Sorangium cellulosum]|nr:hypothetical protein [Sorangium cellulosum]
MHPQPALGDRAQGLLPLVPGLELAVEDVDGSLHRAAGEPSPG